MKPLLLGMAIGLVIIACLVMWGRSLKAAELDHGFATTINQETARHETKL